MSPRRSSARSATSRPTRAASPSSAPTLPILPPGTLPPRKYVPLEALSRYLLKIAALPEGGYEIRCEGKVMGTASAKSLDQGVNLNTLLLESRNPAPWEALAKDIWAGKSLEQIGTTKWKFE